MTIAAVLADRMGADGLTQGEVAQRIGVSQAVISRWLAGKDAPKDEYLPQLVVFTGLSKAKILDALHEQRRLANLPARVSALEAEVQRMAAEMARVAELLERLDPAPR